jgi:aryl-alcohol dehydrogenase-like predicted oxidoreductase
MVCAHPKASGLATGRGLRGELPQTFRTQTITGIRRHRQAERFIRAPAAAREIAGEFGAATGAGEAAWFRGF